MVTKPVSAFTWSGNNGDWGVATNWNPKGPPGPADTATLTSDPTDVNSFTAIIGNESFSVITLNMSGANGGHQARLTIGAKGSLTVGTLAYAGKAGDAIVTINDNGLLNVTTALTGTIVETITIQATGTGPSGTGGHLALGNLSIANSNVTVTFDNNNEKLHNTGEIEFQSGFGVGSTTSQQITNIAWGDEFVFDGAQFTGDAVSLDANTHVLTVKDGTGHVVLTMSNLFLAGGAANSFIAGGDTIEAVCFVRGTMIRTPDGDVAVERLRAGGKVITLVDGRKVAQQVKWLGHRRINLGSHARPETVAPIRIGRGAFAEAMPHNDLLLSPDHAVFVDGKLICARQLVNGTTIRQEKRWTAVEYYHVELDAHAILLAEGLPAESYLNTGNRGFFANGGKPLVLHPDLTDESGYPARAAGSCAAFVSDEASVLPVWQRLAERAAALGEPMQQPATTGDPDLRIVAKGRTLRPLYGENGLYIFILPKGATEVRLVSRAGAPAGARPWLDDRRYLGVNVERIVLRGSSDLQEVPVDHPWLSQGWHEVERGGTALRRWTGGDAKLKLPVLSGPTMLEIRASSGGMEYLTGAGQERRVA